MGIQTAAGNFERKISNIRANLKRLSEKMKDVKFDDKTMNWCDCGSLGHLDTLVQSLTDITFHEGEYTPEGDYNTKSLSAWFKERKIYRENSWGIAELAGRGD